MRTGSESEPFHFLAVFSLIFDKLVAKLEPIEDGLDAVLASTHLQVLSPK